MEKAMALVTNDFARPLHVPVSDRDEILVERLADAMKVLTGNYLPPSFSTKSRVVYAKEMLEWLCVLASGDNLRTSIPDALEYPQRRLTLEDGRTFEELVFEFRRLDRITHLLHQLLRFFPPRLRLRAQLIPIWAVPELERAIADIKNGALSYDSPTSPQ
jgi:hypothetical protein